jgi:hypothetical protein
MSDKKKKIIVEDILSLQATKKELDAFERYWINNGQTGFPRIPRDFSGYRKMTSTPRQNETCFSVICDGSGGIPVCPDNKWSEKIDNNWIYSPMALCACHPMAKHFDENNYFVLPQFETVAKARDFVSRYQSRISNDWFSHLELTSKKEQVL